MSNVKFSRSDRAACCPKCGEKSAEFVELQIVDLDQVIARFCCLFCSPDFSFFVLYSPIAEKAARSPRPALIKNG